MNRALGLSLLLAWVASIAGCSCDSKKKQRDDPGQAACSPGCPTGQTCDPETKRCVGPDGLPDTAIAVGPPSLSTASTARFEFTATSSPASFVCQVDSEPEQPCTSPFTATIAEGAHTFSVAAIDEPGNRDPSPATWTWIVDSTPPVATLQTPASGEVTGPDVTVTFVFSEPATPACRLNDQELSPCASPQVLTGLPSGTNLFTVSGTDPVGNLSAPASVFFRVNRGPILEVAAAVETPEDMPTGAIAFKLADPDTALSDVTVSASSSDTTLFPPDSLVLGGAEGDRTLTATPASNASGVATVTLTAFDGYLIATSALQITVQPVNDPPVISSLANQAIPRDGTTGALTFTVADLETPAGQLMVTTTSTNASLLPQSGIALGGSEGNRTLALTPTAGQTGASTVTVTVSDGVDSASSTFALTVGSNNQPPTLSDIPDLVLSEDTPGPAVAFTVADLDTPLSALTLTASSSDPSLLPTPNLVLGGTARDRTIGVSPARSRSGVATVTVTVSDGVGSASDSFRVTVNAVNDAPTVSAIGDQTLVEGGTTAAVPFTVADVETPAADLVVTAASSNTGLIPATNLVVGGAGANRTLRATGLPNQSGAATVTLTVSDGSATGSTSFLVTVNAVNDRPTITAPTARTIAEDGTTGPLAFTVSDAETSAGNLSVVASSSNTALIPNTPANLALGGSGADRTITVTPAADQSGSSTLILTVSDGTATASAAFVVTVTAVNDAPTMTAIGAQTTAEDSTASVTISASDVDDTSGTFSATSNIPALIPNANGAPGWAFSGTGLTRTLALAPAKDASGSAEITAVFTDSGGLTASQTFTLTVTQVNDPPTMAVIADPTTAEDTAISLTVAITDPDDSGGTFSASSSNSAVLPDGSGAPGWIFSGEGLSRTLTLTPAANANTTADGPVAITARFTDSGGLTATQTFALTVTPVNDAPSISDIANQSAPEDGTLGPISFAVGDVETAAGALVVTASSASAALLPPAGIALGGSGSSRTITLTPAGNQSGTTLVTVSVSDGAATSTDTFALTVGGANDPPTLTAPAAQTLNEDGRTGELAFTVGDIDTPVGSLAVTASSSNPALVPNAGANLILGGSGANRTITVVPAPNQSGGATLTLTVSDGVAAASAQFDVTVAAVNDAPTITPPPARTIAEDASTGALAFSVGDIETAPGSLDVSASSANPGLVPNDAGSLVLGGSGANRTITVVPARDQSGVATLTLTVSDGSASATGTFTVTVAPVNDAPTLTAPATQRIDEDHATAALPFSIGDLETAPASLTVTASSSDTRLVPLANLALGGSGANRTITVTPASDQSGSTPITLTVSDGTASTQGTFLVEVAPVDDAPAMAAIGAQTTLEDTPAAVTVLVTDVDDTSGTYIANSSNTALVPLSGLVYSGIGLSRTLTVTPARDATGAADITATFADSGGLTASRTFTLTVTAVNDAPTMTMIAAQTATEDTAREVTVAVAEVDDTTGTFTASSSNPAVVPNIAGAPGWAFAGTGLTRTLRLTPAANANTPADGPASITATFIDPGGLTASRTFSLTVTPVNDAPTLTAMADVTGASAGAAVSRSTTLGDFEDTDEATANLAVTTSDPTLFTAAGISVSAGSPTRTLSLTPAVNRGGSATVTATYADSGGLSASRSFVAAIPIRATASASGPGSARVSAATCAAGASCDVSPGTVLTFTATPSSSGTFAGWSGSCINQGATASVTAGTAWLACTASFRSLWAMSYNPTGSQGAARANTVRDFAFVNADVLRVLTTSDSGAARPNPTATVSDIDRVDGSLIGASALFSRDVQGLESALGMGDIVEVAATGSTLVMASTGTATAGLLLDEKRGLTAAFAYPWDQWAALPSDVIALRNGDFAYVEAYQPSANSSWNGRVVRLNARGEVLWSSRFCDERRCSSGCADTRPAALAEMEDGALVVVSEALWPDPVVYHLLVSRFEGEGKAAWQQHVVVGSLNRAVVATGMRAVSASEVAISGYVTEPSAGTAAPATDMFVMRAGVGARFVPAWFSRIGAAGVNEAAGQLVQISGGYVVTGWGERGRSGADLASLRLRDDGQSLSGLAYSGPGQDVGFYVRPAETTGYYLLGSSTSFSTDSSNGPWFLRVDGALNIAFNTPSGALLEKYDLPLADETKGIQLLDTCNEGTAQAIRPTKLEVVVREVEVRTTRQAP